MGHREWATQTRWRDQIGNLVQKQHTQVIYKGLAQGKSTKNNSTRAPRSPPTCRSQKCLLAATVVSVVIVPFGTARFAIL